MDLLKLSEKAEMAILKIDQFTSMNGSTEPLESIKQQMIFLRNNALTRKDPIDELGDKKLTYGIIASRELASPDELDLKEYIDEVSAVLDE